MHLLHLAHSSHALPVLLKLLLLPPLSTRAGVLASMLLLELLQRLLELTGTRRPGQQRVRQRNSSPAKSDF
jgi:hypothetical protein